jgi:lipopolysaccharide export system protein LptA
VTRRAPGLLLIAALLLVAGAGLALPRAASGQGRPPAPSSPPKKERAQEGKAAESREPVTVDSDRMERFGKESLVVFTGNVIARQDGHVQYADRMEVYLNEKGDSVLRTVSKGNVRIVTKDCRTGTAQRAEYYELEKLVKLIGDARVWEGDNVVSGDTIDIYVSEDRSVVQGGKGQRVKAQFFPKDGQEGSPRPAGKPSAPCPG